MNARIRVSWFMMLSAWTSLSTPAQVAESAAAQGDELTFFDFLGTMIAVQESINRQSDNAQPEDAWIDPLDLLNADLEAYDSLMAPAEVATEVQAP